MYTETLESTPVRPHVALLLNSLKAVEEDDLEPSMFTEVAARKHREESKKKHTQKDQVWIANKTELLLQGCGKAGYRKWCK